MSKIVKIKRVLQLSEMTLNKGNFPPDFVVLYSNFVQNQVTAPCNRPNCLAWHVLKDQQYFDTFCKFQ